MTDTRSLSHDKLTNLISETEETLTDLKAELASREEAAQHAEIDRLDEHLASCENGLNSVRDFFKLLLTEVRKS